MDRANIWGNGLMGRKCDACGFFRDADFLPEARFKRSLSVDLRGALAAGSFNGFMATPVEEGLISK